MDVWFLGQIDYCTIEHPWIINEIFCIYFCSKPDNFKKNFNDNNKRNFKDKRFGFGGKKKGSKANTKSSANDVSEYHKNGGGRKGGKKMGGKNKRVGKDRRKMNANKRK